MAKAKAKSEANGHTLMQISVFAENKLGKLHQVTAALAAGNVNILVLTISSSHHFGVLKFICDHPGKAAESLRAAGFTVSSNEVIAIEMQDKPGGLMRIAEILAKRKINIDNADVLFSRKTGKVYFVIEVADVAAARKRLARDKFQYYHE